MHLEFSISLVTVVNKAPSLGLTEVSLKQMEIFPLASVSFWIYCFFLRTESIWDLALQTPDSSS